MRKDKKPVDLETVGGRISYLRDKVLRLSRNEFLGNTGLSSNTLKSWEDGSRTPPVNKLEAIIIIFGSFDLDVSQDWLLNGEGDVPTLGGAKDLEVSTELTDVERASKESVYFKSLSKEAVTTVIESQAMSPEFKPGEIVGGDIVNGNSIKALGNHPCIVCIDGEIMVRELMLSDTPEKFHFRATNPKACEKEGIKVLLENINPDWVSKILFHRKRK